MIEWLGVDWVLSTTPIDGITPEKEAEMVLEVAMFALMLFGVVRNLPFECCRILVPPKLTEGL